MQSAEITTFGNPENFTWAIMSLFAWLVPRISMEIGEYHRAMRKSPLWASKEAQDLGRDTIRMTAHIANLVGVVIIVGTACAVALNTKNLEKRMVSIVIGLSRLVGAVFIFFLSCMFPEWLEVYQIRRRRDVLPVDRSLRSLRFNVMLGVLGQYFRVIIFLMPFYCGANAVVIPVSAIVGIFIGIIVDCCVYWGHQHIGTRKNWVILFVMVFIAIVGSGLLFASGALYINDVWGNLETQNTNTVGVGSLIAWIFAALLLHFFMWHVSRKEVRKMSELSVSQRPMSVKYKNIAGEMIFKKGNKKVAKSAEVARSAGSAAKTAALKVTGSGKKAPEQAVLNEEVVEQNGEDMVEQNDEEIVEQNGEETVEQNDEEIAQQNGNVVQNGEKAVEQNGETAEQAGKEIVEQNGEEVVEQDSEGKSSKTATGVRFQDGSSPQDENGAPKQTGIVFQEQDEEIEPYDYEHVNADDPPFRELCKAKCCCFGGDSHCCAGKETCAAKTLTCVKWTVWAILAAFSLYFVIINAGATYQQDVVRAKLPAVKEILYKEMNYIEVCAYDGDGTTGSLNETSNITTFQSKDAAHEAGFLILHCGPCAACSTWPNIKYEYTTRNFLADASAACGRMSLFGGPEAVHECLMSEPINWDYDCGWCWQIDIQCSKSYCAFNFLQSTMINTMTNFAVGMDEVTAASCEEANCEAFPYPENFVECSGATRRRMNVTSSIARPKDEECANVDVDWAILFPGE
eukprot:CAMPEP_0197436776 /NCGR_PEP_ID=MMETSP1175-20131217/4177_1 /TAXON_ID=1003142 /ORGANISM="Triceratium dubium, Strain CCMP147" /LENGTH=740 /DNA_ID=CAMNT_0042966157 /DNA_START=385 /DNA_END=2607 /DNA_ORIENTATION=-